MSSFAESSIVVRFTRPRSCMCFKRGGDISFLFFYGRNTLYGRRHPYQVFNVTNFKINIYSYQVFFAFYTVKKLFGCTKLVELRT